jgi:hypothetical protein
MLDGRIDTQGTVADLRDQGVLGDIEQEAGMEAKQKEPVAALESIAEAEDPEDALKVAPEDKKPRKFIKDEHRETGGVKWSIYNTYLKAS